MCVVQAFTTVVFLCVVDCVVGVLVWVVYVCGLVVMNGLQGVVFIFVFVGCHLVFPPTMPTATLAVSCATFLFDLLLSLFCIMR